MHRRRFIFAASLAAVIAHPPAAIATDGAFTSAERARIAARLERENFTLTGELRRKGQLVILVAVQQDVTWRLVLDGRSGDIIGRRPLAETISLAR
jgi:hypothetical protein